MIIVVAPDSYKGSMSAMQAAQAMKSGIQRVDSSIEVRMMPMADGGEGFVEAIVTAAQGTIVHLEASDPLGRTISSFFGLIDEGKTAVIEMAAASGLPLVPWEQRNPLIATTFGTGQLIKAALDLGVKKIYVGLGGSATNDGGVGMAQALGYRFTDAGGYEIQVGGTDWLRVAHIDSASKDQRLEQVDIIAACDVNAVLYGANGASVIFGPQKGADNDMVLRMDEGLRNLARCVQQDLCVDVHEMSGGGAAGGLGAGMVAFCGARLCKGVDLVLEACRFEQMLEGVQLVITGEGNTDEQSAMGKTPIGVASRAKSKQIPVVCISGGLSEGYDILKKHGLTALFSMMPKPAQLADAVANAENWLEQATCEVVSLFQAARSNV